MAGFENELDALRTAGAGVIAASVDPLDRAREVAEGLSFPVAWGVTRAQADMIGAWWDERRAIVQPAEFLLDAKGKVVSSTYSSGPIGRVEAADVIRLIQFRESRS